jgi:SAM-dependent methyltransferase
VPLQDLAALRERMVDSSPLDAARTREIVDVRYARVPHRVAFGLRRWPLASSRVLDVGCSFGMALAHFGDGSLGIDNAQEAVSFCEACGLSVRLIDVDDETLSAIPDASFDFLWVSDVLEHLDAPRVLLRNLAPKLVSGGKLLLHSSVLPRSRASRLVLRRLGRRPFDAEVHYHQFTVDTLAHLVERAGYRVTNVVVPVPDRLAPIERLLPVGAAPRLIVVAEPDELVAARVQRAEQRNKAVA